MVDSLASPPCSGAWRTLTRLCKPPSPTQFLRYAAEPRTSYKIVDHSFLQLEDASNTGTQTSDDTAGSPSPSGKRCILIKEKPDVFHTQNIWNWMRFSTSKTCDVDRMWQKKHSSGLKKRGVYDLRPLPATDLDEAPILPSDYEQKLSGATVLLLLNITSNVIASRLQCYAYLCCRDRNLPTNPLLRSHGRKGSSTCQTL
jgi:hypothetical protein